MLTEKEKMSALEMVRKATENKIGKFSKQDIRELCPSLSISSIEGLLKFRLATRSRQISMGRRWLCNR